MSKIFEYLSYCKGISDKSMISAVLPSYDRMIDLKAYIKSIINIVDPIDDDNLYFIKACNELLAFLQGIVFQDCDKKGIGLIIYMGITDNGSSDMKTNGIKIFHTFPIPANSIDIEFEYGDRFNMKLLNKNKWFIDEFYGAKLEEKKTEAGLIKV